MDYHQKMIVRPTQNYKSKDNDNDDDDEDLEALRLAALMSLKAKSTSNKISQPQKSFLPPTNSFPVYNSNANLINNNKNHGNHRRRDFYPNRTLIRQNGIQNAYHPSRNNQNLIEIIPVDENTPKNDTGVEARIPVTENEDSKFQRFNDNASGSEDEDTKPKDTIEEQPTSGLTELSEISEAQKEADEPTDEEVGEISESVEVAENSPKENLTNEDDEDEENDKDEEEEEDDDDDVLLMADLEEEDSLERLMDEMEREMADKPLEKKEKKSRRESKSLKKDHDKSHKRADKIEAQSFPTSTSTSTALASGSASASFPSTVSYKNDRPVSPYERTRHRSVSPKVKRKKSPRRSPPRLKKSRDIRQRSPRPPRHSPPRSPKKLSPRRRSRSRSPRNIRSRLSPPRRSKSPGRSPRPRSPFVRSSRSPRLSPRRLSPRRLSPRRPSPRLDRGHSPQCSPIHSPWSSPRNSPRLSPKRRRSPPSVASTVTSNINLNKDKRPRRSKTPEDFNSYKRENSPDVRSKIKATAKEINEINDPVLEARRRKFESTKLIDPINDNKKIKLSRKVDDADEEVVDSLQRKADELEDIEDGEDEEGLIHEDGNDEERDLEGGEEGEIVGDRHGHNSDDVNENEGNEDEEEGLCLNESFDFDELAEHISDETVASQMIFEPVKKLEKSRTKKKKKKDKEIYQVGKLKSGELPLSERLGKEKKCKKRKEYVENVGKEVEEDVNSPEEVIDEEADLRTELSRRRAERLNRNAPIQSARLLQSAFKGVVNEVAKNNSKVLQRQLIKEEKHPQKEIRRVTVLHRSIPELHDSEDEILDSKVPIKFRLGLNKVQETRESKVSRKSSKRQSRKVKHKNLLANN
ncbi:serine/arginine repetitive matrix protein 1 isoform X1 [Microplitis demolitor]|uniref:serine/arginine repetitive matrix protein 1 isoform X1 n=1 Tax=Microplitis demolitor TaxID=69319 RepID=UPI0004CCDE23|nr:serine/arginine repetitive matrix protein 1 isoform X1 [Microplitis demolitor]